MDKGKAGKATWDAVAHRVFLDVCVEEVQSNNRPTQCLNNVGYANLRTKFNERTKRKYERKQFKNRWETLKKDCNIWKTLNQHASGLGRDPVTGTIEASDDWWEAEIKRCPEAAKFRVAPLDSEDKMRILFDAHSVTNEHARVPGAASQDAPLTVEIEEQDAGSGREGLGFDTTPVGTKSGKKRTTGYSPSPGPSKKRVDNDTSSIMHRLLDVYEKKSQNSVTSSAPVTADPVRAEIAEMMALVEKDGAEEGSDEHFYATQLLRYKEWRDFFITLKTPRGRLAWLKRTWETEQKKH